MHIHGRDTFRAVQAGYRGAKYLNAKACQVQDKRQECLLHGRWWGCVPEVPAHAPRGSGAFREKDTTHESWSMQYGTQ